MKSVQAVRRLLLFLAEYALVVVMSTLAWGQVETTGGGVPDQRTPLQLDAIGFAGQDASHTRLDVFVQVAYDNLSFTKQAEDVYNASYELTVSVQDSTGALATEKLWTEQITGITFGESVAAGASRMSQKSFTLVPGLYKITVSFRDLDSKVTRKVTREVTVRSYPPKKLALSDILLIGKVTLVGGKRSIVPNVSPNVGQGGDAFYVYCETYTPRTDSLRLVAAVLDRQGTPLVSADTTRIMSKDGRNETLLRLDHSKLAVGDYQLRLALMPVTGNPLDEETFLDVTSRAIKVQWRGMPLSLNNLDMAIEQLRYLAKDDDMKYLKEATSVEEKQKRFLEFWKKRDPNPNTPRNEKMDEYYARVDYANKHFTHYVDGWRTDMGMVYILYGPPSSVDRHPFEVDSKPYEVWAYFEVNQQFVFVDETGFGDYRLATPLWEVWQRPRD